MNDLTTPQQSQSRESSEQSRLTTELAKMLSLVAPITMSADQQSLWLASAVDALKGIRAADVEEVSVQVRRTVTRPSQIVPEIIRLAEIEWNRRSHRKEYTQPQIAGPPPKIPVMNRRGQPMSEEDTAELNEILEKLGAVARYRLDGSRYTIEKAA